MSLQFFLIFLIPDINSLKLPCESNHHHTLSLREDISEMEAAAKKFEQEEKIFLGDSTC